MQYALSAIEKSENSTKQSMFLVTINPNIIPSDQDDAQHWGSILEESVKEVFSKDNAERWIKFLDDGDMDDVESIKGSYGVEIGKKARGGRLHLHMLIEVLHNSKIHLNLQNIREDLNAAMKENGISSVYVNVRAVKGGEYSIRNYILKDL